MSGFDGTEHVAIRVEWDRDVDGVADIHADLPEVVDVPTEVYEDGMTYRSGYDDAVSDYLSDTFGFLVTDWQPVK